jgi:alkaline phosphatase
VDPHVTTGNLYTAPLTQTLRRRSGRHVIFFLGDGMGSAPITAARILSKGITEGRYDGMLEMDRMEYRGMATTSGYDAISTDSANSMPAYMCGHKSSVNAMGVYATSDPDPAKHPHVETMAERVAGLQACCHSRSAGRAALTIGTWSKSSRPRVSRGRRVGRS